jgi:5'-deoxynucleotidase YfbR-like HD superfamily hydrolase
VEQLERLYKLREAASVERFHTARTLRRQSVGEHSFNVAMIIQAIAPGVRKNALLGALYHDLPEIATGDIPAPVKWANPTLRAVLGRIENETKKGLGLEVELSDAEVHILQWADMFELLLWAYEEYNMGNQFALQLIDRARDYLDELGHPTIAARILINDLDRELNPEPEFDE